MTDRELLERAAKAAGYEVVGHDGDYLILHTGPDAQSARYWWSPLTDDGDALRLAVKLRMRLDMLSAQGGCEARTIDSATVWESGQDHAANARRAIVRAAAAMAA